MADTKFSALAALTAANVASDDVIPIIDTDATTGKKITVAELAIAQTAAPLMRPTSTFVTYSARSAIGLAPILDRVIYVPLALVPGYAYTNFGTRVTAQSGSGVLRIGIYTYDQGVPGTLITDGGTVASTTTGAKYVAINYTAWPSVVFVAVCPQTDVTGLTLASGNNNSAWSPTGLFTSTAGEGTGMYYENSVSGALPATATPAGIAVHNSGNCCVAAY